MTTKTKTQPVKKPQEFLIQLPQGSKALSLHKAVIVDLLQQRCNLTIADFHLEEDEGTESFVIRFT